MLLPVDHHLKLEVEVMLHREWDLMVRSPIHEILALLQHITMEEE
jgi:hypothetical protein